MAIRIYSQLLEIFPFLDTANSQKFATVYAHTTQVKRKYSFLKEASLGWTPSYTDSWCLAFQYAIEHR